MIQKLLSTIRNSYESHPRMWLSAILFSGALIYTWNIASNPPGFYLDESSIAYNAHTIAQTGKDEHGIYFPLYFRAFGEFKNPTYIYLLAALDRVCGPSILLARLLSAFLGFAAALVLGLLAKRVSGSEWVGMIAGALALFDPWLFELSRLVYEVTLFPLLVALLLFVVRRTNDGGVWRWADSLQIAILLGLLTYTYSIGRLLGPLFAFGLLLFATRSNWIRILRTWALYGLTLFPLLAFIYCNPNALTERFFTVSYIRPDLSRSDVAREFAGHYLRNLDPRHWIVPDVSSWPDHIPAKGGILTAIFILFIIGLCLAIRDSRRYGWPRYLVFGLVTSIVPAALTTSEFHTLRLAALPVFVIALASSALPWLVRNGRFEAIKRPLLVGVLCLGLVEIAGFQYLFHTVGSDRGYEFEARYPEVLRAAMDSPQRPIILYDLDGYPSYIHAYWYSTLQGLDTSRFRRLPSSVIPPQGSMVLGTAYPCGGCRIVSHIDNFSAYTYDVPATSETTAKP